ncbi:hypothetical protein Pcinc_023931 [Petrolisthes cinctipes]|uniref:Uncharacterized protein n=1 Tax=Petrolisthes cinctipes TaxID=88211 RepID=A0AAE1FCL1_PETCI|nr:hypothetical protein Pcinc_023931 [Petrolisthes cinctipes]
MTGDDVGKFVLQQQAIEREERAAEREERVRAVERECEERVRAAELEGKQRECEEKLQLAKLEANKEIKLFRIAAQVSSSRPTPDDSVGQLLPSGSNSTAKGNSSVIRCHNSGEEGHIRPRCPKSPRALKDGTASQPHKAHVADYLRRVDVFPVLRCYLRRPYFVGWTDVLRAPIKFATALVRNVRGVLTPTEINDLKTPPRDVLHVSTDGSASLPRVCEDLASSENQPTFAKSACLASLDSPDLISSIPVQSGLQVGAVQSRSRKMKNRHPLVLLALQPLSMTPDKFSQLQAYCVFLGDRRDKATSKVICQTRNGATF